jgi:hypothetical protein
MKPELTKHDGTGLLPESHLSVLTAYGNKMSDRALGKTGE